LADEYDTNPASGAGFAGAFGVYPSPVTGNIYINDSDGVFVFGFDGLVLGSEDETANAFAMSPNPASDRTVLKLQNEPIENVRLHNVLGAEVMNLDVFERSVSYELDLSNLDSGVYFVTVNNAQTKKIVVN